jgi:NitT/TauT family transport system substrate-binding protein
MPIVSRRAFCAIAGLAAATACDRTPDGSVLRLGYLTNVTHAPALTGIESGRFAAALRPVRLEPHSFNAGPAAMEALLAEALDVAYLGPSPAVAGFLRSRGQAACVVAGATSGGASFVVRAAAGIHGPGDLHHKRIATPQLGNTQDIALRTYLRENGLAPTERGGDVQVTPLGNPDIMGQFQLGHLDGAWVPEPWATRLQIEAGGVLLFDERDRWTGRRFATTVVVARRAFLVHQVQMCRSSTG